MRDSDSPRRVLEDTPRVHGHTRAVRVSLRPLLVLLALCAASARASEPEPLHARVVSSDANGVLVTCADSARLVPELSLVIARGRRTLAHARIERVLDAHLAQARVTAGSLARAGRLDRLRVLAEATPRPRVPLLRVGVPGRTRACLLFACDGWTLAARGDDPAYRQEWLDRDAARFVRVASGADSSAWPDTVLVRGFAEPLDQEIALERGELDVAVFWPGELSARARADERWRDPALGLRSHGLLAALGGDSAQVAHVRGLETQLFAGDLLRWSDLTGAPEPAAGPAMRYSVDAALPGRQVIERVLARETPPGAAFAARLTWLPEPLAARDSLAAEWRARGITPLDAVRCPVLAAPGRRALIARLGGAWFANLVECAP